MGLFIESDQGKARESLKSEKSVFTPERMPRGQVTCVAQLDIVKGP